MREDLYRLLALLGELDRLMHPLPVEDSGNYRTDQGMPPPLPPSGVVGPAGGSPGAPRGGDGFSMSGPGGPTRSGPHAWATGRGSREVGSVPPRRSASPQASDAVADATELALPDAVREALPRVSAPSRSTERPQQVHPEDRVEPESSERGPEAAGAADLRPFPQGDPRMAPSEKRPTATELPRVAAPAALRQPSPRLLDPPRHPADVRVSPPGPVEGRSHAPQGRPLARPGVSTRARTDHLHAVDLRVPSLPSSAPDGPDGRADSPESPASEASPPPARRVRARFRSRLQGVDAATKARVERGLSARFADRTGGRIR